MRKIFTEHAFDEYLWWQAHDRATFKRINVLIKDIDRNGYVGIGKPEGKIRAPR
jgi:toxin YoeB